ncbi:hypothetical protein [Fodinibius sediminis]|uniref:Uncharacterized protein n=1 Tax=Fodinibius sediminis TaxID=1214077 RepID=A0A521CQL8_9BACT|nr:hypothetical protein [Fodinibius sediminis]SMO61764.1 hypothetical protein SAMN06265218_1072 [Fodinibius sediminis]
MVEKSDIESATIDSEDQLKAQVKELIGNPISVWAVAATIESLGIREVDARKVFGYDSIFSLADQISVDLKKEFRQGESYKISPDDEISYAFGLWEQIKFFSQYYSEGLLFSLPLLSQIAALFIFRYSLWAWLDFNEAQATIIAFGTIVAFIITGGFIQVLGHVISGYTSSNNYFLAYECTKKVVKGGLWSIAAVALLIVLINIIIPFYPRTMVLLGVMYMVSISLLLLASGILYALKRRISIFVIFVIGTLSIIFNIEVLNLDIYSSHWIAMFFTTVLLTVYARRYFKRQIHDNQQDLVTQTPPDPEVRQYIKGLMKYSML